MTMTNTTTRPSGADTVAKLVDFQQTGAGFDLLWADIHPIVAEFARRNLVKIGVRLRWGDADGPVGEVVNETCLTLQGLSAPGAGGRFRPEKMKRPGISGMRAWLWRVVRSRAVNWQRDSLGVRRLKNLPKACIPWNHLPQDEEGDSIVKRIEAKFERPDLRPILQECINELPDFRMREMVWLKLDEELSVRATGRRLDVHDSSVQRCLSKAYELLRPLLEDRGVDVSWLAA